MTQFEKAIKTIAIVIAVFVVIVIIGGIITAIVAVTTICSSDKAQQMFQAGADKAVEKTVELKNVDEHFDTSDVEDLEVNNAIGTVKIIEADTDEIHVTGTNLNDASAIELHNGKLYIGSAAVDVELFGVKLGQKISEKDIGITIEIPKEYDFESIYLVNSMGVMEADYLEAESIHLENGMGEMKCKYISSPETKIEAGVGNIELRFEGTMNDYDMKLSPGIGSITVDSVKQSEMNHTNRDADKSIRIESGAGKVTVEFEE